MKNIVKSILIYLAGFITAIIIVAIIVIIGISDSAPDNTTHRQGLTIFLEQGDIINETQFEVFQVIESNLALATGKGSGTYVYDGVTVLLMRDEGKYFYDDEKINLSSKPNQAGIYQYETKGGNRKTVPVIKIK